MAVDRGAMMTLPCFKAYDIRGRLPDELNEDIAYRIGRAYAELLAPQRVVVGRDVRLSSESLCQALANGLADGGADVFDLGLCGTEEIYFATFAEKMDGGIMVTASHNPMDYNGMKLVRGESRPISGDSGLNDIRDLAARNLFKTSPRRGAITSLDTKEQYVQHLLGYVDLAFLRPLKIVVNAGNGCAGPVIDRLAPRLPFEFIRVHHQPDGNFPNGIPNPLLPENREATCQAVIAHGADLGLAWDGDFDRCFFFDGDGRFIEGYYLVGLLAEAMLARYPGAKIIHDPRLTWNTIELVKKAGGVPVQSKTGHAFIKERMRAEDAVYGGEMSAHHYFREFAYCDSGMIPWLLVTALISRSGRPLSALVNERIGAFPCSGEINYRVPDVPAAIDKVLRHYRSSNPVVDHTDGVSLEFDHWRLNVRGSNTEPLLRLNIESRGDLSLVEKMVVEVEHLLSVN